eukprot:3445539-Rhodomonas_salina.2
MYLARIGVLKSVLSCECLSVLPGNTTLPSTGVHVDPSELAATRKEATHLGFPLPPPLVATLAMTVGVSMSSCIHWPPPLPYAHA